MSVPSLIRLNTRFREVGSKGILKIIFSRLFPLFLYKEYFLYENENKIYTLKPKLNQTKILSFFDYKIFEKYQKEQNISLLEFDQMPIKEMMNEGAIPFCAFIENQLAHITWVALDNKAKESIENWPMKIDWKSEACWGLAQTTSTFKRTGLYSCVHAEISRFLKEKGIKKNKYTINKKNLPSSNALNQFSPNIFGEGFYIKILFWQFRITKLKEN